MSSAATMRFSPPDYLALERVAESKHEFFVEVLSPSTESYDRGKKFEHYRSGSSLGDYVLISQDRVFVEHFSRQPNSDQRLLTTWNSLDAVIAFESLGVSLPLRGVYAKIELPSVATT